MQLDRKEAIRTFDNYVNNYDATDTKIKLKIDHTYRVCELCEKIAKESGFAKEDIDIAWLTGLLHDVGRFEQLRQYGTFSDAKSIDHAALSAEILFEQGKIRDYIKDSSEDELLQKAVRYHSAYRLPEDLNEREMKFCHLLRDADKIDILKVNVLIPLEEIYDVSTEELLSCTVSEQVMGSFKEEQATLKSLKRTAADNVVGHISLAFELVYPASYKIVKEQGYLKKLMNFHSNLQETNEQFKEISMIMDAYFDKKLKNNNMQQRF